MALWIRNNCFVNLTRLHLLCEKTGALAIVEPGFMAGWLTCCLADETFVK